MIFPTKNEEERANRKDIFRLFRDYLCPREDHIPALIYLDTRELTKEEALKFLTTAVSEHRKKTGIKMNLIIPSENYAKRGADAPETPHLARSEKD